jgi:hypothetical protein
VVIVNRPCSASYNCLRLALIRRSASSANFNGFLTPLIIASIIRRPLTPMISVITESSLMLASSSV